MARPTIHQMPVAAKATPIRAAVPTTRLHGADPSTAHHASQATGPMPTSRSELAFTPPTVRVTSPKIAA